MTVRPAAIVAATACGIASLAHAHHGIANFDLNQDIALEGTVTRVDFMNPHSWLYFDVASADGKVTAWRCEMRGATVLTRSGWEAGMFAAGMRIRVTGSPDRRDPATCYLGTAFFPDGSSIDRYGQRGEPRAPLVPADRPARLANGDPNIAGDWAAEQRVMTDPRGQSGTLVPLSVADRFAPGGVPEGGQAFPGARGTAVSLADDPVDTFWNRRASALPLTEAGAKAIEGFDGSSADNPRLRCAPTNILFDWTFEADINRIAQTPERIDMLYGSNGIARTIHLNLASHPASVEPSVAGHSIGRWENDVLIVDTVGFAPGILLADGRVPHSGGLHVVERFTVDAEKGVLARSFTAEDPAYFAGAYTGSDTVLISDLPYHGTTECQDLTIRPGSTAAATSGPTAAESATEAAPAERPWYMFWKIWD
jgi:uncharacterized protein DUF6152